jgi:hypothetical protein
MALWVRAFIRLLLLLHCEVSLERLHRRGSSRSIPLADNSRIALIARKCSGDPKYREVYNDVIVHKASSRRTMVAYARPVCSPPTDEPAAAAPLVADLPAVE